MCGHIELEETYGKFLNHSNQYRTLQSPSQGLPTQLNPLQPEPPSNHPGWRGALAEVIGAGDGGDASAVGTIELGGDLSEELEGRRLREPPLAQAQVIIEAHPQGQQA